MQSHTTATNYLDPFPSAGLRPLETAGSEAWEEDSSTVSSIDLGSDLVTEITW
jgi:hypothetical protein